MPSFNQHLLIGAILIAIVESFVLASVLDKYLFTSMLIVLLFLIGNIMPDIDLPHKRWYTTMFTGIIIPIVGFFIVKRSTHWGKVHSIGFGLIFSVFLAVFLSILTIFTKNPANFYQISLLSGAFFAGFITHLVTDQLYHEYYSKQDFHIALKIWSNKWTYDPLIWIFKRL